MVTFLAAPHTSDMKDQDITFYLSEGTLAFGSVKPKEVF